MKRKLRCLRTWVGERPVWGGTAWGLTVHRGAGALCIRPFPPDVVVPRCALSQAPAARPQGGAGVPRALPSELPYAAADLLQLIDTVLARHRSTAPEGEASPLLCTVGLGGTAPAPAAAAATAAAVCRRYCGLLPPARWLQANTEFVTHVSAADCRDCGHAATAPDAAPCRNGRERTCHPGFPDHTLSPPRIADQRLEMEPVGLRNSAEGECDLWAPPFLGHTPCMPAPWEEPMQHDGADASNMHHAWCPLAHPSAAHRLMTSPACREANPIPPPCVCCTLTPHILSALRDVVAEVRRAPPRVREPLLLADLCRSLVAQACTCDHHA